MAASDRKASRKATAFASKKEKILEDKDTKETRVSKRLFEHTKANLMLVVGRENTVMGAIYAPHRV